jgi:hypothetical protein
MSSQSFSLARFPAGYRASGLLLLVTSLPTPYGNMIFDHAIKNSAAYDAAIREKLSKGKSGEALFFELALEDISRATALFRPIYDQTDSTVHLHKDLPLSFRAQMPVIVQHTTLHENARSALECGRETAALNPKRKGGSWRYRTPRRLRRM